jgi:LAS superfamily LD-carboxypeptidase LdcB
VVLGTLAVLLASGATGLFLWEPEPERVCARSSELRTRRGVTLLPEAMEAFAEAERLAGRRIEVVESFRSCRAQARACQRICGNRMGCPGTCAAPGLSWHQRGLAIDISEESLLDPAAVDALQRTGWCQSVPANDPGHFSFDGCH